MTTKINAIPLEIAIKLIDCKFYTSSEAQEKNKHDYLSLVEEYNSSLEENKAIPYVPSLEEVINWVYVKHGIHIYCDYDMPYSTYTPDQSRGFKVKVINTNAQFQSDSTKFAISKKFSTKEEAYIEALTKLFNQYDMTYHGLPIPKEEIEVEGITMTLNNGDLVLQEDKE